MKGTVVKEFSQLGTNYRIVETADQLKYALEYETADLVGAPQWRTMCATAAALTDPDPLAVMLRELRTLGWF